VAVSEIIKHIKYTTSECA